MSQSTLKPIKGATPSAFVVTANDLLSGDVVYFTPNGSWSVLVSEAQTYGANEQAGEVSEISNKAHAHLVVGVYVLAIGEDGVPLSTKERLRATGPSNYFHGKQEVA